MSTHFGTTWTKKTRKARRCDWCAKKIEIGSVAARNSGIEDGDGYWTTVLHPECQAALDSIPYGELQDGYMAGDHARGRTDDDFGQPPQFSADYRGKEKA